MNHELNLSYITGEKSCQRVHIILCYGFYLLLEVHCQMTPKVLIGHTVNRDLSNVNTVPPHRFAASVNGGASNDTFMNRNMSWFFYCYWYVINNINNNLWRNSYGSRSDRTLCIRYNKFQLVNF